MRPPALFPEGPLPPTGFGHSLTSFPFAAHTALTGVVGFHNRPLFVAERAVSR